MTKAFGIYGVLLFLFFFSPSNRVRADLITVVYSGYGHDGRATQPVPLGTSFNSGTVDSAVNPSITDIGNVTTSDSLATSVRTLNISFSGNGTNTLNLLSNYNSLSTVDDPNYIVNKQIDGGYFGFLGFTVDQSGIFQVSGNLSTRNIVVTPGPQGNYAYFGLGGNASLEVNNFPVENTVVYTAPVGENIDGPVANTIVRSFSTTQFLTAGTTYQLNFGSYMYQGFGGTGTIEHNTGWNITIAAVPEPSSIAMVSLAVVGAFVTVRRRSLKS